MPATLHVTGNENNMVKIVENCSPRWYNHHILKRYAGEKMGNITFSEIMKVYPAHNMSVYDELKTACQKQYLIPFVGAGLSVFCGYKGWSGVLKQLAKYIYDSSIREHVEALIEAGDLLQAAQDIQDNYPRMSKELPKIIDYSKVKNCDNDSWYASAAYVLPYLFGSGLVMTTNFDRCPN